MNNNNDVGRRISILSNQIRRQFDNTTSVNGVTGVQRKVLHFILAQSQEIDIFQKDIEEEFNLRRSSATGVLQLMEQNNLIRRESVSYDARLKKIIITEKAMQMKGQVLQEIHLLEEKLKRNISDKDLELFFKVINQMSKNLE
ncbi:MarR family winged helix-turn-helix transcriptional regulator [Clostridium uliginosum]|uniref:DNA-binding transcriptional regulator, MarR family n=1 Tax=Clostridium uliginosum TaxID=119641 RepID=A0A1I1HZ92_9CLOT|nr:MarR family transcriptional regulator [Clostridium uliginosum]SFC28892.1 DNA-binding transcriptional regulator, MarR family [Clostridium uliginosum]